MTQRNENSSEFLLGKCTLSFSLEIRCRYVNKINHNSVMIVLLTTTSFLPFHEHLLCKSAHEIFKISVLVFNNLRLMEFPALI